jgi:hypothetical protein
MYYIYLISPGPRPFFGDVAYHLWGAGCDCDTDGDAYDSLTDSWTELTVSLRPDCEQQVDIDPLDDLQPLVLVIRSKHESLAREAAIFLQSSAGGELSNDRPKDRGRA